MKKIAFFATVAALFVAYALFTLRGAIPPGSDESAYELALVSDKCAGAAPGTIDRHLLQQSWFHDAQFTRLAGSFGQSSFSLHPSEGRSSPVEGAYCIAANTLMVRYFERDRVPIGVDISPPAIEFGVKLSPTGHDSFELRQLTATSMTLGFASDGRDHLFYRRN